MSVRNIKVIWYHKKLGVNVGIKECNMQVKNLKLIFKALLLPPLFIQMIEREHSAMETVVIKKGCKEICLYINL